MPFDPNLPIVQTTLHTSSGLQLAVDGASGALLVTGSFTGSVSLDRGFSAAAPLFVTGSIGVSSIVAITGSVSAHTDGAQLVSGTVNVTATGSLAVTGSVGITNFPVVQRVTGSVGIDGITFPESIVMTTTGSIPILVQGQPINVTGSVGIGGPIAIVNGPAPFVITSSGSLLTHLDGQISVNNFPTIQAVSGSVSVFTQGPQLVSGGVNLTNWPAVIAVSGSQLTGSTFVGMPAVAGGVFQTVAGHIVKSLQVDVSGSQYITASGSLNALVSGTVGLDRGDSAGNPLFFTGSVGITQQLIVTSTGSLATKEVRSQTAVVTSIAASVSNVTLLSGNVGRLGASITNDSATATLYVKMGTGASLTSYTAPVRPTGYYEVPFNYVGQIDGIWDIAVGNARVTEVT